jgi:uncharacterized protein
MAGRDSPHLPYPAPIESYGNGGFRFAGMSHHGSILAIPAGTWAVDVASPADIGEQSLALVFSSMPAVEHLLIGTGRDPWRLPEALRARLRARGIVAEAMTTSAAVSTYNLLLAEGRRIGALLIAVP